MDSTQVCYSENSPVMAVSHTLTLSSLHLHGTVPQEW